VDVHPRQGLIGRMAMTVVGQARVSNLPRNDNQRRIPAMTNPTVEDAAKASSAALQELTKAYQDLAAKNARNLTAAIQALSAVKSPTEFIELQQKLIKEGVEAAMADSQNIAQLTTAVFTAAFEPVKQQIEAVQKMGHR
jgi:hypothetical protein